MKRFTICLAAAALAIGVVVPKAVSAPFVSLLTPTPATFKVSDDSGEFLFNRTGGQTTLDVGDVVITGFNIHTLERQNPSPTTMSSIGGGGANNSVNGISVIQVAAINGTSSISFKPLDTAALAALAARADLGGISAILSTWKHDGSGNLQSMVALYDAGNPNLDFQRNGGGDDGDPTFNGADIGSPAGTGVSENAKIVSASVGSKMVEFGFTGAAGEFWFAAPQTGLPFGAFADVGAAATASSGENFGVVNFGLNQTDATGFTVSKTRTSVFAPGATFGLVVNANLQGTEKNSPDGPIDTPFDIQDDFNGTFRVTAVAPEPSSMVLLGIGVASMCSYARIRQRRAKG